MNTFKKAVTVFLISLGIYIAAGLVALGAYPLYKCITANGETTYCYVDTNDKAGADKDRPYRLYGHREWRIDATLGKYMTLDDAVKAAERLSCKVK